MEFTESVRSFQVPATPCTSAWPPSLPSVPTSRATRVTSAANEDSWSTMVLMVFFSSRISPFTSTVIFLDRSPAATAVVTSAMLRTCEVRLPAMKFTESVKSFQVPATPCTSAWPPSLPSVPTSRATRVTSEAKERSWSTMVLMVFFSSRISPFTSTVIFLDRSPAATAVVTSAMLRTWPVRLPAMEFTESVRSFQVPATPCTSAWPPSLPSVPTSRATRVTSDAKERSWSTMVLMVFFSSRISPLHVHRDLLGQVAGRHRLRHVGDVAHLAGEVAGHGVHRVGQVLPGAGHALHSRLAAQLAFGTHFARHPRHFRREGPQLVHHGVDGVLQLEDLALHVHVDLLGQVAGRHGRRHVGDVAHLGREVAGHEVHRVGQVLPGAGHALHLGLAAQLAFGAHFAGHARHFGGEGAELLDHLVDDHGGAQEFAFQSRPSTSSAMLLDRSPWATAPITRATSLVGCTRSSMRELMQAIDSRQKPRASGTTARCLSLPSLPTTCRRRVSSDASMAFCSTRSLKASATFPERPSQCAGSRTFGIALAQSSHRLEQHHHVLHGVRRGDLVDDVHECLDGKASGR